MKLKSKLSFAIGMAGLATAAYLAWGWIPEALRSAGRGGMAVSALVAAAAMLLAARFAFERLLTKPMERLLALPVDPGSTARPTARPDADPVAAAEEAMRTLRAAQESERQRAQHWEQRAKEIQAALHLSEERYALALRGAADGLWERDLASGRMQLSPRWKSLVGFSDDELQEGLDAWRGRLHPADRAAVEQELEAYLAGSRPVYERQFRVLHKDGSIRWLLSRGTAIRHASGKPYRIVGLDTDITRVKRVETILEDIAQGTAGTAGGEFFRTLVRHFAGALQVPCAFVTRCADFPPSRLRTLAFWSSSDFLDNFEYDLPGTPCDTVVNENRTCFYPSGVGTLFPREAGYEGYLGIPLVGSDGRVIGHLAFLDTKAMGEDILVDSIHRIFSARAAAELERLMALELLRSPAAPPGAMAAAAAGAA